MYQPVTTVTLLVLFGYLNQAAGFTRIVNGTDVQIEEYPYQVSLQKYPNTESEEFLGGGTLIGDRWVLAAAHSFQSIRGLTRAYVGVRVGSTIEHQGGDVIDMIGLSFHPGYSTKNQDNDFALVRLRQPYTINPIARAIKLVDVGEIVPEGTMCVASGWGDTMGTGDSQYLKAVEVPIVNHAECKANYASTRLEITENMMCAGYAEGMKDACAGDSGGPLVCNGKLTGVVSWGKDCAQPKFYGVYAVVANAREWIKTKTGI